MRHVAEITFDHHDRNPDFIRIVAGENILLAAHFKHAADVARLSNPALDVLSRILESGREKGLFRTDVDTLYVHLAISIFCFFRVANRFSWNPLFDRHLAATDQRVHQRRMIGDMIVAYLTHTSTPD